MVEAYHVTTFKNIDSILKQGLIPTIGERSQQIDEPVAAIYFFPTLDDVDTALLNWLGDEFDEDEELALLKVNLRKGSYFQSVDWELISYERIPINQIEFIGMV